MTPAHDNRKRRAGLAAVMGALVAIFASSIGVLSRQAWPTFWAVAVVFITVEIGLLVKMTRLANK